jgi:hypothetical protein
MVEKSVILGASRKMRAGEQHVCQNHHDSGHHFGCRQEHFRHRLLPFAARRGLRVAPFKPQNMALNRR